METDIVKQKRKFFLQACLRCNYFLRVNIDLLKECEEELPAILRCPGCFKPIMVLPVDTL